MRTFKGKTGIILIVVLWVMFFLSIAVLTLGVKNRMNVRLRALNNAGLRMSYLAKEGVNRAIDSLIRDDPGFDALSEDWSKPIIVQKDDGLLTARITDENRFININNISEEILNNLKTLFPEVTADQIAAIIKNRPFNLKSEINDLLTSDVLGSYAQAQTRLLDMLTTFSDGTLNINTVPEEVLMLIPNMTESAAQAVIAHRQSDPFSSNETLSEDVSLLGLKPAQVSSLIKVAKVNSNVFRIIVDARAKDRHIAKNLEVVVSRKDNKISILLSKEN